jgi:hypothetical protein
MIYQCEDDRTPAPGVKCWVTGNAPMSSGAGYADVDGGKVSLLSPSLNMHGYIDPIVRYWRWCTNETSLDDSFWVYASSDGGTSWQVAEYVPTTENTWTEITIPIKDVVTLSTTVRFKFVATDYRSASLTEGMLDDFQILNFVPLEVVEPEIPLPEKLDVSISPNPFNSAVRIGIAGKPEQICISDILGRKVYSPKEPVSFVWSGKNDIGADLPSGIYFIRISKGNENFVRRMTLLK